MQRKVYFISGHLDLTESEFCQHYAINILIAHIMDHCFVVGDARGADRMAQMYLKALGVDHSKVSVFHMFHAPRNNVGPFHLVGGFQNDNERDEAMTFCSNHDIAWVRPERKSSGTQKNLDRRISMHKAMRDRALSKTKEFQERISDESHDQ